MEVTGDEIKEQFLTPQNPPKEIKLGNLHEQLRPEVLSSYLPPLKPFYKPSSLSRAPKTLLDHRQEQIDHRKIIQSLNNKLRNDRFIENYIKGERKRQQSVGLKSPETPDKKVVFRSAKIVNESKLRQIHIKPQLQSLKNQYKIREESIQRFLTESDVLENYKMLSHLGKGSFSVVSLAINKETNKRFAIKTYAKIDEIQAYKFDNIFREINHLHTLSHENIVGLFHVVKDKRKLLLVMEDGGKLSLAGLLRKNKTIPEAETKKIFKQILLGIEYCHKHHICHRDIKLENILVDTNSRVKIIDFGFSSKCGHKLQNFCGTPPYMAPEIAAKVPYYGEPADMWALGILLYLMLFGKFPFRAVTEKQLYRLIQQGKFQMGEGVSVQAKEAIRKLLRCNVRERATAQQMLGGAWLRSEA